MKYKGKETNSNEVTIYTFAVGKEELEILAKTMENLYRNTPAVFSIMPYRGRLRQLTKELAKVLIEEVRGNKVSTKRTHKSINKQLS